MLQEQREYNQDTFFKWVLLARYLITLLTKLIFFCWIMDL